MKILTTAAEIRQQVTRLIGECVSCEIAVAWASVSFDAYDLLVANLPKIERMVVGTHFYQTHPQFIETFLTNGSVRFVLNPDGVFHPKVYLFEKPCERWECIIGSPNFTQHGFACNSEVAVLLSNEDYGAEDALRGVKTTISSYWQRARAITPAEMEAYRAAWKRKQLSLKNLKGKFGNPNEENSDDHGKDPIVVPVLAQSWPEYFGKVKGEKTTPYGHSMAGRLKVIEVCQHLFANNTRFKDIDSQGRLKIAGLMKPTPTDSIDYRWFGSMMGAGKFWRAINTNDDNLSLALDLIPKRGVVSRETYLGYIDQYRKAFPDGRDGIGTASRLLAMKRPDTFVCFDARNREGLCEAFGISRSVGYEEYWDSIISRIMEASWWCSPPPLPGVEREVWEARAAFLDSLFYDGADMAES